MAEEEKKSDQEMILIVDQDASRKEFYTNFLNKSGKFEIDFETTCKAALAKLEKSGGEDAYGLVLIDWQLQDMPGYVFAQKIRSQTKFDNIELAAISNSISADDLILLAEMDIGLRIQKSASGPEFLEQIEPLMKARAKLEHPVLQKIQEFKNAISKEDLDLCEKMMKDNQDLELVLAKSNKHIILLAQYHLMNKKFDKAMSILQGAYDLLQNKDKGLKMLSMMARVHTHAGRHTEALKLYDKLIDKSPKNLDHKVGKGDVELNKGNVKEAKEQYNEVLKVDPSNTQASVGMGKSAVMEGNLTQATSLFQSIKGDFENEGLASFFNNRGVALSKAGKTNEALALYKSASKFIKKYQAHIKFNMGLAHTKMGNKAEAKKCFDEVLKIADPKFIEKKAMLKKIKDGGKVSGGVEEFVHSEEEEGEMQNRRENKSA